MYSSPRVGQVLFNEFAELQTFVQLTHQQEAAIGGDPRSLEIDVQRGIKRELKCLILFLTQWGSTS